MTDPAAGAVRIKWLVGVAPPLRISGPNKKTIANGFRVVKAAERTTWTKRTVRLWVNGSRF